MADTDDSLMREVREELRREQFAKFWDRYGVIALIGVGLFIASILGYQYWQQVKLETAQKYGEQYQSALQFSADGKVDESTKLLITIAKEAPKGYAVLARLKLASLEAKAGKIDDAVKTYEAIVNDGGADQLLAGYAKLRAATLRVGTADWTEMQNRLNDLVSDDSAWRFSARELLGLAAMQASKLEEARKPFRKLLSDRATPRTIRARVTIMMGMIAQKELGLAKSAKEQPKMVKPDEAKSEPVTSN